MANRIWQLFKRKVNRIIWSKSGNRLKRYGFPTILLLIIFGFKLNFASDFGNGTYFLALALVINLSAWYGGFKPGIYTTLTALVLANLVTRKHCPSIFEPEALFRNGFFVSGGFLISMITQARKEAEEMTADAIGILGHELRNPLTAVGAYADLIKRNKSPKKIALYSEKIKSINKEMDRMVKDLCDMSRVDQGTMEYIDRWFQIKPWIEELVKQYDLLSASRKIILRGNSNRLFYGDRDRMSQILGNIIANAVSYSDKNSKVRVSIEDRDKETLIFVHNKGKLIPKEVRKKIFERYFQVKNNGTKVRKGLGLGLYIAQMIAKRHQIKLWVISNVSSGTKMYLLLPQRRLRN